MKILWMILGIGAVAVSIALQIRDHDLRVAPGPRAIGEPAAASTARWTEDGLAAPVGRREIAAAAVARRDPAAREPADPTPSAGPEGAEVGLAVAGALALLALGCLVGAGPDPRWDLARRA